MSYVGCRLLKKKIASDFPFFKLCNFQHCQTWLVFSDCKYIMVMSYSTSTLAAPNLIMLVQSCCFLDTIHTPPLFSKYILYIAIYILKLPLPKAYWYVMGSLETFRYHSQRQSTSANQSPYSLYSTPYGPGWILLNVLWATFPIVTDITLYIDLILNSYGTLLFYSVSLPLEMARWGTITGN